VEETGSDLKEIWSWIQAIFTGVIIALLIRQFLFGLFIVNGESMFPTLENSEALIVNKLIYNVDQLEYGEVIVFQYPSQPNIDFIKRVIGLPGDEIQIVGGKVYRNGQVVREPYLKNYTPEVYGPVSVPDGTVFVLGDNRSNSLDSRDPSVGMVPLENLVGRAELVLWPLLEINSLSTYTSSK
jgi:signal peptidase I